MATDARRDDQAFRAVWRELRKPRILANRLQAQIAEFRKGVKDVRGLIYSIGGPLNDNKRGYTPEQMGDFRNIVMFLDCELGEESE